MKSGQLTSDSQAPSPAVIESLADGLAGLLVAEFRRRHAAWLEPQGVSTIERERVGKTSASTAQAEASASKHAKASRRQGALRLGSEATVK